MVFHDQIAGFRQKYNDIFYTIFRVLIGLLFAVHGAQKIFGLFGNGEPQAMFGSGMAISWLGGLNMLWIAGIIELLGGLLIALGLLTGISTVISSLNMLAAYFVGHFTLAMPLPYQNRGELTLVYLAAFIFILLAGGGKYSLDRKFWGKSAAPEQVMKH